MLVSPSAHGTGSTSLAASRLSDLLAKLSGYRSIRLTTDGTRFIVLTIAVGVAAINTGNNLLYLLFAMMLSLIIVSGVLSEQCLKHISISRRVPGHLYADQEAWATFLVTNTSRRMPALSLRILDVLGRSAVDREARVPYLPVGQSASVSYRLRFNRRGRHRLDGVSLCTRFPFGFFDKSIKRPVSTDLLVYPALLPLRDSLVARLEGGGRDQPTIRRGPGSTLYNLRLYQPGDDSRSIHWKTTARKSQLIIKELEAEEQQRIVVTLAMPPRDGRLSSERAARFEHAVSLAASVAAFYIERGYEVMLIAGRTRVPFGAGAPHLHRILAELALCEVDSASNGDCETAGLDPDQPMVTILPWPGMRAMGSQGRHHIVMSPDA